MAYILDHLGQPLEDQFGGVLPPGNTAWEALLLKSTAVDGSTAWVHLMSSIGTGNCPPGSGGGEPIHVFPTVDFFDEPEETLVTPEENETEVVYFEVETTVEVLVDDEIPIELEEIEIDVEP